MQIEPQKSTKTPREYPFKPGMSGNPTGQQKRKLFEAQFTSEFRRTHSREPTLVEAMTIAQAGTLAAKVSNYKLKPEHVVRCGRLLRQLLDQLGLASPPAKRAGKSPLQSLDEHLAATHGGSR
jgi:hypothetical protein